MSAQAILVTSQDPSGEKNEMDAETIVADLELAAAGRSLLKTKKAPEAPAETGGE